MDVQELERSMGSVVNEGWVHKKSRFLKAWRERYLVLTPLEILTYKQAKKQEIPTESIKLEQIQSIQPLQSENGLEVIEIKTNDREYQFGFDTEAHLVEWQGRIAKGITRLAKSQLKGTPPE